MAFAAPGNTFPGTLLAAGVYTDTGPNNVFTNQPGESGGGCPVGNRSGWWQFTAPFTTSYQIDTIGSSTDTVLSVWNVGALPTTTAGVLACNDNIIPFLNTRSRVTVNLTAGVTYQIRVAGPNSNQTYRINITMNTPPTITAIADQTTNEDTPMGLIFGVNDVDQLLGAGLTLSATSSNAALVPVTNITLNRITVVGILTATPVANQNGTTTITVRVTDPGGAYAEESFVLTVLPIPDPPTDITLSSNTVAENATAGTVIGTLTTTDPDIGMPSDSHTYSLIDNAGGRFQVVGNQIQVLDNSLLDFETNPTHSIIVQTTDSAGLTYQETLTINVTNIVESLSINDVSVTEGNTGTVTTQFTITLSNTSNQTITVNYATANVNALAGADYVAVPATLVTFAPGVTTQTVDITVNGDFIDEVDETYNVILSAPVNGLLGDPTGVGTIIDDDVAGVIVTPTTITVAEPNTAQTYTIVLTSQPEPGETVTVTGGSFNGAWITVGPIAPTFNDTNWDVAQTVTVTAIDNFLDDDTRTTTIAEGVTSTSATTPYGNGTVTAASVVVTINDDDVAGVIVTPTTVTVTENGPVATYTAVLTSQPFPGETVTITTGGYDATWITATATVTFTDANWNVPQTVTVSAVDNFLDDDTRTTTIANTVTSTLLTSAYSGTVTASSVLVNVQDDDVAGVIVTPTTLTVSEPATSQTYTVVLTSQPFPGETVTISTDGYNATWITVSAATLTFDASNWNVAQTVTVTAVDNFLDDDTRTTTIADGVTGSDPLTRYGDGTVTAASVVVTVLDDEVADVIVTPITVTVSEPATSDVFTVVLTSQPFPSEVVTIITGGYNAAWITATATVTFDDTNWNVPQTVTVTAVDNFLDDDTRTTTIANGVSSNQATAYNTTVTADSVVVTVLDDEVAGVIVTPTTVTVSEPGTPANYTAVLTSQPFPGEVVTITTSGFNAAWIAVTGAVTFNDTNWNVPQTFTVAPVDNFLDDDTRTTTVANGVTSNQATAYNGTVTASSVLVTVLDDEVAGVIVNPTAVTVTELGPVQTYTVVLTSQPFPGETVTITNGGFNAVWIGVAPTALTFDETNWNVAQTVTVSAVDNFLDDDTRTTTIANGVTSNQATAYNGTVTAASVVVTVMDNETAGVTVNPTAITITENGAVQTYTVVLTSQPFPGETVTITNGGFNTVWIGVALTTLTFDETNWNVAQTVTVSTVNNFLDDDTRTTTIANGVAGSNPLTRYGDGTVTAASVVVTSLDDDVAGVTVNPTALTVAEPATSQTYTVVLTSQPFPSETVTISTGGYNNAWISVSAATLTFNETNWNIVQTVTVTAIDNLYADGTRTTTIADGVTGSDPLTRYGDGTVTAASVVVTINDNDVAGVVASPTTLSLAEPVSSQTYTVVLTSQPLPGETVTITLSGFNVAWIAPSAPLTFDGTNWNIPQTFTVDVIDNLIDEGGPHSTTISNVTSSNIGTTPYGNGSVTPAMVIVTITNDDVAGVTVNMIPLTVAEPNVAATYSVVLNTQPAAGETVRITPGGFNGAYVSTTAFITFTGANWNIPQNITVSPVDNLIADGTRTTNVANAVSSNQAGTPYGNGTVTAGSVDITILDNDIPGVTINPLSVTVTESSPAQNYTVQLNTQPAAGETVSITLSGFSAEVTVGATTLNFTDANWNVPQAVTVGAVDNFLDDGTRTTTIAHAVGSSILTTPYGNGTVTAPPVAVTINDEDVSGVTINPTALTVAEPGTSQTYTVVLTAQPFPGETVTIMNGGFSTADITVSPTTMTFDNANWNVAQTVTITAIDNLVAEGTRNTTIANGVTGSNPATAYGSTVTAASVVVTVTDNDVAGVVVNPTALTVAETGASQTYTFVLTSQPAAGEIVTLTMSGYSATDISVIPATINFNASNWNVAQTVTVSAIDNFVADGTRTTTIVNGVSSNIATTPYGNGTVVPASVVVTVNDNDVAGVNVTPTALTVTELGLAQTYSVALTSQPAAGETVTITIGGYSGEITVNMATLTFTGANWTVAQTVTVAAVDNFLADGARTTTIVNGVSSNIATTPYGNGTMTAASVGVTINDNDIPGVGFSVPNLPVMENDPPHTYTVTLTSQPNPGEVVTITLTSLLTDLIVTPLTPPLTFDDTNWNVPVTITVEPINNSVHDGDRAATIDHAVTSSDATSPYGNGTVTTAIMNVAITDDDIPGAVFVPRSLELPEGGDGSYRVHLSTEPLANVSVTLTFDDTEILVNGLPSPVVLTNTWTPTTYGTDIYFIVSALGDSEGQGGRTVDITHTFSSTDPDYNFTRLFPVTIGDVNADSQAVPRCVMLSLEESTIARAVIIEPISVQEIYCRIIVQDRVYAEFLGPGNIGNQAVMDMGIIHAVDIFVAPYYEDFTGGLWVCLMGRGDLVYMSQSGMPRQPQLLESMFIDGFTCTTIPNAGTLVLVDPIDYSTFTQTPATCDVVTNAEVNLRQGATTSSTILQVLPYDTTLHVNAVANGWYRVEIDGVTGWVSANWVREVTSCAPPSQ